MSNEENERLARLETKMDTVVEAVNALRADTATLAAHEERFKALSTRVDAVEKSVGSVWNRLWVFAGAIIISFATAVINFFVSHNR